MAIFTTIANITKVDEKGNIYIKGVGKYSYEKNKDEKWIVLENVATDDEPKFVKAEDFKLTCKGLIQRMLLTNAMLDKKSLKLTIREDTKEISAIEVP
mgnify:FL=1|jgi:hypothetical protein